MTRLKEVTPIHDPAVLEAVVRFVVKMQCCSLAVLFDIFGDVDSTRATAESVKRFRSLLHHLVEEGRIRTTGTGQDRRWLPAEPDVLPPQPLPPAQYNCMAAPPDVGPAMRPGALDFKQCASRGHRC